MNPTTTPLITESASVYDSLRATHLTSSGLRDYIKCPKTHKLKTTGIIPRKTSKAFEIGTAAHVLILEGVAAYDERYYIINPDHEPVNDKTGKPYGVATKAYTDWLDSVKGERTVLSASEGAMVAAMADSVRNHDAACELLEEGQPEGVIRATIEGVKVQTRMDWYNPNMGITDLKTIADLDDIEEHFTEYGYDTQLAFYQMIAEEVMGHVPPVYVIAVEKAAPNRTGVFAVSQTLLETKRAEIVPVLKQYAASVSADFWPTRYDAVRVIGGGE